MPIYEYRCDDCGHELEKLQRMSDDPLRDCPACGAPSLRRLISAAAFRLKGSGWYETDFKKDNQRNLAGDGKPPEAKKDDAEAGKAGDKTADKGTADKAASGSKDSASRSAGSSDNSSDKSSGKSSGKSSDKSSTKSGAAPGSGNAGGSGGKGTAAPA